MLAMRSTQDSTIPPSQSAEFLRKDEVDLYRYPWQYIRSDLVALREMANTGDLKKKEYRACIHETIWNSYIKKLLLLIYNAVVRRDRPYLELNKVHCIFELGHYAKIVQTFCELRT